MSLSLKTDINIYKSKFKQIIFSKYKTNLKIRLTQRCLKILGTFLLLFKYDTKTFLIDIIATSASIDQKFYQWQCSIWSGGSVCIIWPEFPPIAIQYLVTRLRQLDYVYRSFYITLKQFYINSSRQGHQIELILVAINT